MQLERSPKEDLVPRTKSTIRHCNLICMMTRGFIHCKAPSVVRHPIDPGLLFRLFG